LVDLVMRRYRASIDAAKIGYVRTQLTSALVGQFVDGVRFEANRQAPALSCVALDATTRLTVEVLKRFAYVQSTPALPQPARRGSAPEAPLRAASRAPR